MLLQDLRQAGRKLRKSRAFTFVGVTTLALGIGATTAIFSVVEAILLRPLPFPGGDRLVVIHELIPQIGHELNIPAPDVLEYSRYVKSFRVAGGFRQQKVQVSGVGDPVQLTATRLSPDAFAALGVAPMLGRPFYREEDENGQALTILSYSLWATLFHRDPKVIGTTVNIDRRPYVIVGVMPRAFEFPVVPGKLSQTQLWVPLSLTPDERTNQAGNWDYGFVGLLNPNTSMQQARADAERVANQIVDGYPVFMRAVKMTPVLRTLRQDTVTGARSLLRVLLLAVLVVLLIACANLAGLLLVRAIRRRHEMAVQMALGAPIRVILRQSVIETLLISMAGGLLGVLLASIALRSWINLLPETLPRLREIGINWTVLAFALALSLGTGLLCGLVPALAVMRINFSELLNESGRTSALGRHARFRSTLVVAEIATALVLLTAATLLLRSFEKMRDVDPGFQPDHLLIASYSLPPTQYQTQSQVDTFNGDLLRKLQQLPGTQSAALVTALPMAEETNSSVFTVDGYNPSPGATMTLGCLAYVRGDYFQTLKIPLLRGRYFTDADKADVALVVIVNRTLAEHYWAGQSPLGKRMKLGPAGMALPWMAVVGEVADTKQGALDSENCEQIYQPFAQQSASAGVTTGVNGRDMRVAVRSTAPPEGAQESLRRTVWSLDPQLAISNMQTMEQAISETGAPRRFNTTIVTAFALTALLFAMLGVYAVVSFSVAQRTQEIGIRIALGAQRGDILSLVLKSGFKLGIVGCLVGIVGSAIGTRLMSTLLFGVSPLDPIAFVLAVLVVLVVCGAASFIPARHAAAIDAMQALRAP
jgi:predicted permease